MIKRDDLVWFSPRNKQIKGHSWHSSRKDRILMAALFYAYYVDSGYTHPRIFGSKTLRWLVFVSLILFLTKMEVIGAREETPLPLHARNLSQFR